MTRAAWALRQLVGCIAAAAAAGAQGVDPIPGALDVAKLRVAVVAERYVKQLQGTNLLFTEPFPDEFRSLVLTLRIRKPAGMPLDVHANDLVLHYRHGQETEVAPANGVSTFSLLPDTKRPMVLEPQGRCGSRTSPDATAAEVVYVDVFFQSMQPDTRELHVLVAQPAGIAYRSAGWRAAATIAAAESPRPRECVPAAAAR